MSHLHEDLTGNGGVNRSTSPPNKKILVDGTNDTDEPISLTSHSTSPLKESGRDQLPMFGTLKTTKAQLKNKVNVVNKGHLRNIPLDNGLSNGLTEKGNQNFSRTFIIIPLQIHSSVSSILD